MSRWSTASHAGRRGPWGGGAPERSGGPPTKEGVDAVLRWDKTEGGPFVEYLRARWTRHPTGRSPAGTGRDLPRAWRATDRSRSAGRRGIVPWAGRGVLWSGRRGRSEGRNHVRRNEGGAEAGPNNPGAAPEVFPAGTERRTPSGVGGGSTCDKMGDHEGRTWNHYRPHGRSNFSSRRRHSAPLPRAQNRGWVSRRD